MKKNGFTLAELCVTLAIIGVVAVLAAPSISALMPDSNKTKIVDLYNRIADANAELVSNPDYYLEVDERGTILDPYNQTYQLGDGIPDCIGLACPRATLSEYNDKPNKYATLLAKKFGVTKKDEKKFDLPGVEILVNTSIKSGVINHHVVQLRLLNKGDNCMLSATTATTCKKPNFFMIKVENDGSILPADPLLEAYLAHPGELKSKKEYMEEAKKNIDKNYYWQ